MHDVFISYASPDRTWVEEELLPALEALGQKVFIDDGEWRNRKEEFDNSGLKPGDQLEKTLSEALASSRVVVLVQSPEYFASKWCRWEIAIVEHLPGQAKVETLYLLFAKTDTGRLDPTAIGQQQLYVDLTDVRERAAKLAFALGKISPEAQNLSCKLGRRSLRDLLRAPEMQAQMKGLTRQHREFAAAHEKMQGFKEIHDTIQRAQDAWYTLANVRDNLLGGGAPSQDTATDLLDKYRDILRAMEAPALEDEKFFWKGQLERSEQALAGLIDNIDNLEALNQALERTHGFLFLSTGSSDLNARLRNASEQMLLLAGLRASMQPLRTLAALPWLPGPLGEWTSLMAAFDELDRLLATIAELVTVHDSLQNIDSIFSAALRIEARLFDIENIWPEIEQERQRVRGGKLAAAQPWLRDLEKATDEVSKYLHRSPKPNAPPKEEIEFFRSRLNQSFNRADTDLRDTSSRLQKSHHKLDDALDRLAKPSQAAPQL